MPHGKSSRCRDLRCQAGLALLLSLVTPASLPALDPAKAATQYVVDVWQSEQGLPQNDVLAICQTRDGYLWLATQEGLVRFDGVRFTVFDSRNIPELKQNFIMTLCEDRQGSLWIGTYGSGLCRFANGRFTTFTTKDGLSSDKIRTLFADPQGGLWIGTQEGLDHLEDGRFTSYTMKSGLADHVISAILEDGTGGFWIGTSRGGLNHFQNGRFQAFPTNEGPSNLAIYALHRTRTGELWIGTSGGLKRFKDGQILAFGAGEGAPKAEVRQIYEDREGSLWIGTSGGGLARYREGRFTRITTKHGLSVDQVFSILEDREGSLWLGTSGGGLNRLRDTKFTAFTTKEGLSNDQVWSVCEDREGGLWIGTRGGGLNRFREGRFTPFTTRQGLSKNIVSCVHQDRAGTLWVGTVGGGLNRFREGRFTAITTKQGLSDDEIASIYEDRAGSLWIGTSRGGLNRLQDGRFTAYTTKDGLASLTIDAMLEDREGALWIGTEEGLNCLRDGRITTVGAKEGLTSHAVYSMLEDAEGTLWFGTGGGGLFRLKDGKFRAFTTQSGLFDDNILQVLEDGLGYLWMATNKGVFRVRKQDLDALTDGRLQKVSCVAYGTGDELNAAECNGGYQPAACRTKDGRLWFPTTKGVAMIDPARIPLNQLAPPVLLEEILVDLHPLPGREGAAPVSLAAGVKKLEFHYTALSYLLPKKVRFRVKLEGFDRDWVEAGTLRTAYYTNLPHGAYRFRVQACNSDGLWNETGASLDFALRPFFYQTRIFQLLCVLALVGAGALIQRLRVARLTARQKELESLVEARTSELRGIQEQLARISEATPEKLENLSAWGSAMGAEIASAIHARQVGIWRTEGEALVPIAAGTTHPPSLETLRLARAPMVGEGFGPDGNETILQVTGITGHLRGALVIEGDVAWGPVERRLVTAFAQHLGSALDLQHLREQLTLTEARQSAARQRMHEEGIHTLQICPRCGRCWDESVDHCEADGAALDASRLLPFRVAGRYRLVELLGEGGMGSVFSANDEKLSRSVALKMIKAEALNDTEIRFRLEREARALAQVSHPSVTMLYDSGELDDGSAFLVMELLRGLDLADLLRLHGPGSPRQVAQLMRQAGSALAAAHRAGVVHRDIKPANLFLVPEQDSFLAKVLDFGVAKTMGTESLLTQVGVMMGTPQYMSPEQLQGQPMDPRSDLYSFAVVIYEALTGRRAVQGRDLGQILMEVLHAEPPRLSAVLPGIPMTLDEAFLTAFAKLPSDRPVDLEAWSQCTADLLEAVPTPPQIRGWPMGALLRGLVRIPGEDRGDAPTFLKA